MKNLQTHMNDYLDFCASQKCLDEKTLKAYRIDLRQFSEQTAVADAAEITSDILEKYITGSRNRICILLKGFRSMISLYSK